MIPRNTPQPAPGGVTALQWANGKPVGRERGSSSRFTPLVGFHIEAGRTPELDAALEALEWPAVEIKHQRPGGAEVVCHWWLGEQIELLPITAGPVAATVAGSLAGGNAQATAEAGLGLRWAQGERSQLAVRGYVRAAWEAGFEGLVQLGVRSRMSDALLAALCDHTRAAEAADALASRTVSLVDLWLPLGAGEEAEWGRGDTATVVPLVSRHPAELDAEYLRSLWRPGELHAAAIAAWPAVTAWARGFAAALAAGFDAETGEIYEEQPAAVRRQVRY